MRIIVVMPNRPTLADIAVLPTEKLFKNTGGNTGNLVHYAAVLDHLGHNVKTIPWFGLPNLRSEEADLLVLVCANHLGDHTDLKIAAQALERLNLPIIAVGLGAQSPNFESSVRLTEGTDRWIRVVADHSPNGRPNIGLRGEYSFDVLSKLGLARAGRVTGCPSLFLSSNKSLGVSLANRKIAFSPRVLAVAGMPYWMPLQSLERKLFKMVTALNGKWLIQSDLPFIYTATGEFEQIESTFLARIANHYCPDLEIQGFICWCKEHAITYFELDAWKELLKVSDVTIGPRIHGVMMSIQMGVPGVCIAHDSRTLELCQLMKVPYLWYSDVKDPLQDSLSVLSRFDGQSFDLNRLKLASQYCCFLQELGLNVKGSLIELLQ